MKFNSSARFNRKAFNTIRSFDAGIHDAGTVTNNISGGPAAFSDWSYRIRHEVYNNYGESVSDHHVKIIIHRSVGVNDEEDLYVSTKCNADYSDIRVTGADGTTELDFWIREDYTAAEATIFILGDFEEGSNYIYIYYGNAAATTASTTTALDRYLGAASSSYNDTGVSWLARGTLLGGQFILATGFNFEFGGQNAANTQRYKFMLRDGVWEEGWTTVPAGTVTCNTAIMEGNRLIEISCIDTGFFLKFYVDGILAGQIAGTPEYVPTDYLHLFFTDTADIDQVFAYVVRYNPDIYSEAWDDETELSDLFDMEFQFTHEQTIEQTATSIHQITPADITATIELTPEVMSSVFIDTTPVWEIPFETGASEITVGETVTGGTSGASGTVTTVVVESGSWGGGDAAGYILVEDVTGVFEDGEDLDGTLAGDDAAVVASDPYRITPIVIEKSCWKSIDEVYWQASVLLDGLYAYTDVAGFKELYIDMVDHEDADQRVFYGFIPDQGIVQNPGDNTTRLSAYSHAWFLSNQYIPELYRDTVEWVPVGDTGYVTYLEPSVEIGYLLGGANWNLITGCKPLFVNAVADWGSATHPIRGFAFGPDVTKWMAAMEIADYLGWVFDVVYDPITDIQGARFCDIDDIDTYMGIPAAVTFDHDAAAKYVLSVTKEKRGTEYPNRIRVQGRRNKRILNFVSGAVEFTPGNTVVDGGTGAEATIISCTTEGGSWGTPGDLAYGYLIISYDRTADFVNGNTIVDELGGAWGNAVMQGNSALYETYDEYPFTIESADVTGEDIRAREKFFQLEEEYDSTPLIEAKAQEYYDMYCLDPIPVTAVFRDRCDLRLWQKVKFTNFDEITEDWLRIVSIKYTEMAGGDVTVTCTLNNSAYVIAQRKMRRSLKNNDVAEIEKIVKTLLAKKDVKVNTVLRVQGEGVTVELEDGSIVVLGRSPEG